MDAQAFEPPPPGAGAYFTGVDDLGLMRWDLSNSPLWCGWENEEGVGNSRRAQEQFQGGTGDAGGPDYLWQGSLGGGASFAPSAGASCRLSPAVQGLPAMTITSRQREEMDSVEGDAHDMASLEQSQEWCSGSGHPCMGSQAMGSQAMDFTEQQEEAALPPRSPSMESLNTSFSISFIPSNPGTHQGQLILGQEPGTPSWTSPEPPSSSPSPPPVPPPGMAMVTVGCRATPEAGGVFIPCVRDEDARYAAQFHDNAPPPLQALDEDSGLLSEGVGDSSEDVDVETFHTAADCVPSLSTLRPFFNIPLKEAAERLQVRVGTVTKWMRYYGTPRWPYRKLKSLDALVQGLWELVEAGDRDKDEVSAVVVLLEGHRAAIENDPCLEISERAKRIRQAVFKAQNKRRSGVGHWAHARRVGPAVVTPPAKRARHGRVASSSSDQSDDAPSSSA